MMDRVQKFIIPSFLNFKLKIFHQDIILTPSSTLSEIELDRESKGDKVYS